MPLVTVPMSNAEAAFVGTVSARHSCQLFAPSPSESAKSNAMSFAAIWTGASADTRTHITHFDRWRAGGIPPALAALVGAAAAVVGALPDAREFMRQLRAYVITLQALDRAARLGIYSAAHRTLSDLAPAHGVIYKPCGAGGGDLGMAFAPEPAALATFERAAGAAGFNRLPLELDEHGITVGVKR